MTPITFSYMSLLGLVAPETIMTVAALLALGVDLLVMREQSVRDRFRIGAAFAVVGCIASMLWLMTLNLPPHALSPGVSFPLGPGMYVDDGLVRIIKVAIVGLTLFTLVLSMESSFTEHVGEYLSLVMLAAVGMMFLASAEDILMIFISLELTSLSLYVLTAFNKRNAKSAEAALKYFLFGGMSAAFTLFGLSFVYGLSGATGLREIAAKLNHPGLDPLLAAAIVMTVIGFGFKVAAVPFHLWAPDAYEGAPTPSAALIASGSKVASFFVFAKVMVIGFASAGGSGSWGDYAPGWLPVLCLVAAASMLLGNLTAIAQTNVKRLLAYSAIAHAGYALLGILANNGQGLASLAYYVITYGATVVGAFAVVGVVEEKTGTASMANFAGLCKREPVVSFCMMIFMLSLAGIPPLAGFFGKFYVFTAAMGGAKNLGLLWLIIFAIAMSAVSLYYYLQVLKQIYVIQPEAEATKLGVPISTRILLCALAATVVLLGCAPNFLVGRLESAAKIAGF